ncbi:Exodeoxyribonuclease VII large subunit [Reichenbachiella agariperforans]|uniref:Exodeoxyribonuclease 7 large subunit n=1 Tax=Reichenbachiella agariperforans TaxID=156994 RepID=A0A1M6K143_REIAG|nr:exodeoxyribonuclease VII large subunit [Reichenbachiella agariperforans]SHJ52620.1 Exodeoxyribonuclease VII large subunit [Reichenbachiella agariperforans]
MEQYSLSEFNLFVKKTLSQQLAPSYWIVAEIGEMNIAQKGHCYMDLVEKENNFIKAKMRATVWSYAFASIHNQFLHIAGTPLKKGMQILLNASFEFHEVYGVSLNIKDIDPNFTLGERERKKRETLLQLEQDGIIDLNRSLVLPQVPQRIAIISSETAAGYGDFLSQINNNAYGYRAELRLFHAVMQGDQAVASIIDGLHRIYEIEDQIDAVVLIRGGGAQTDLDCFDDYDLCAHIAQFPLPIITGIGHERDQTLADRVANVNLKTPTAVAEFIISGMMEFESSVNGFFDQIAGLASQQIKSSQERLIQTSHIIDLKAQQVIQRAEHQLDMLSQVLYRRPLEIIRNQTQQLTALDKLLHAHDPQEVLKKGYSITKINGQVLNAKDQLKAGDHLETYSYGKEIRSTITEVNTLEQ